MNLSTNTAMYNYTYYILIYIYIICMKHNFLQHN